mgnify:CR=1 FL=1
MRVSPLTPSIGAEIEGVNLSHPDDDTIQRIHQALMQHLVVFFRDQMLSPVEQVALARCFGRLRLAERAAFETTDDAPELAVIIHDETHPPNVNHYHTDGIFRREPEFAALLQAVEVPTLGGDTLWVNLQAAYDSLDETLKTYVDRHEAENDFMKLHGSAKKAISWKGDNRARMEAMSRKNPPVVHPLVRVHPVTGRKSLYLSESFTTHVIGEPSEHSEEVLNRLFRHYERPEFQCRFRWQPGSMALWDNRATLHYAVADYWPARRVMHRVTIETDAIGDTSALRSRWSGGVETND